MSKSLTVKKFITLSCEAIYGLSKPDARETYKSIKDTSNPIWSDFTDISKLLSQKVELNEEIEELEDEIDDNPDNKQQYISQINQILSSESTIKLIYILETGFNKNHGTFAQISDDYSININTLQNYKLQSKPIQPKPVKNQPKNQPIKTTNSKNKNKKKPKTETTKNGKNKTKLNKQKSIKNSKLNKRKSIKTTNSNSKKKKKKSMRRAGKSSTTESASKYKRRNNAKTDKTKNLSPSKIKRPKLRNRSSTEEDIKNGKTKTKTKNKKYKSKKILKNNDKKSKNGKKKNVKNPKNVKKQTKPKSPTPTSPITPISAKKSETPDLNPKTPVSPQVSATEVYNDHGHEQKQLENVDSVESIDSDCSSDNSHISTESQDMNSAFAMFERLSKSPKISNNDGFFGSEPVSPKQKVQKKGKRYCDFKAFSSGAFSKVYKAKDKENENKIVAVKKIHIGGNRSDKGFEPTTKEEGDNEIRILKLVNDHNNTCNLVETYFDMKLGMNSGYVLCIVMEYMNYTLKDRMDYYGEKGENIPFDLIKIYLFQLCKGVNWMHIKNVCHRDIKPENVLIDIKTNRLQLCDFGCSIVLGKNKYNNDEKYQYEENDDGNEPYVMSRFYRAPELILGNREYDCYADIWSLGVVISEIFLGTILFMGSSNLDQMREIILKLGWPSKQEIKDMNPLITKFDKLDGVYGVDKSTMGESFNMIFLGVMDMEESAVDLISQLLVYSPDDRLSAGLCLQHKYFNKIKNLLNKSIKKKKSLHKKNLKMKKEDIVPNDLIKWNDMEIQYAKEKNIKLKR